jgi:hypothetical protein
VKLTDFGLARQFLPPFKINLEKVGAKAAHNMLPCCMFTLNIGQDVYPQHWAGPVLTAREE